MYWTIIIEYKRLIQFLLYFFIKASYLTANKIEIFYLTRYNRINSKGINYMTELSKKIEIVKSRLKEEFLADTRPWVVTFSRGKDSQ